MNAPAAQSNDPTELDLTAQAWREAKAAEDGARQRRVELETQILELAGVKEEGSQHVDTAYFRVTTVGKLTRSLDAAAWEAIRGDVPADLAPVDYKPSLDLKKLRAIETANPELYQKIAQCISTKPAKPSIKVDLLDLVASH